MKARFLEDVFAYDGTQLRPLFNYLEHGLMGNSIVAWTGPCDIPAEHMVDGEDLIAKAEIRGSHMLHFIVEVFDVSLFSAVCLQRIFAGLAIGILQKVSPQKEMVAELTRDGDDIFLKLRKLSISIAAPSINSQMIHFALNISNEGTPVKTLSLEDLQVNPRAFAEELMASFSKEIEGIQEATWKVRSV